MKVFQAAFIVIACVASAVFFIAMNRPLTQASANVIAFSSLLCLASLLMFGITRAIECFHPARDVGTDRFEVREREASRYADAVREEEATRRDTKYAGVCDDCDYPLASCRCDDRSERGISS